MEVVGEGQSSAPSNEKGAAGAGLPTSAAAPPSSQSLPLHLSSLLMPTARPSIAPPGHHLPHPQGGAVPAYDYRLSPSAIISSGTIATASSAGLTYPPLPQSTGSSLSLAATLTMPLKRPRGRPPLLNKPLKAPKSASPRSVQSNDDDVSASSATATGPGSSSTPRHGPPAVGRNVLIRPVVPVGAGTCGAEGDGDAMQQLKVRSLSTSVQSQKIVNYLLTGNPLSAMDIMALLPHVVPDQILGILDVLEMLGVIYKVRSRQAAKRSAVESSKGRKASNVNAAMSVATPSSSSSSIASGEGEEAASASAAAQVPPQGPAPPQYTLAAFARAPSHISDVRKIKDDIVERKKNAENTMNRIAKLETFLAHLRSKSYASQEERLQEVRAFMNDLRAQQKQLPTAPPPLVPPKSQLPEGVDLTQAARQFTLETDSLYAHIQRALDGLDKASVADATAAVPALVAPSAPPAPVTAGHGAAAVGDAAAALAMQLQSSEKDAAAALAALASSLLAGVRTERKSSTEVARPESSQ